MINMDSEIAEVIMLYGTQTDAVAEMNNDIQVEVYDRISAFEEAWSSDDEYPYWLNAFAYSFTDDVYIQIYNTYIEYPTYGYSGQLFGFVYDITNDNYVTLEETLDLNGTTKVDLEQEIADVYNSEYAPDYADTVDVKAFNYTYNGEYYVLSYLMELTVIHEQTLDEPHHMLWAYTPEFGELYELNRDQLFDPSTVDQYDPPLHGQEGSADSMSDPAEDYTGDSPAGHLSGRYFIDGDTAAASFEFSNSTTVDAYVGSGSYETSYSIGRFDDMEGTDDNGDTVYISCFNLFDENGDHAYIILAPQNVPDAFDLYTADEEFVATCQKAE
jgi:hypothetical protein